MPSLGFSHIELISFRFSPVDHMPASATSILLFRLFIFSLVISFSSSGDIGYIIALPYMKLPRFSSILYYDYFRLPVRHEAEICTDDAFDDYTRYLKRDIKDSDRVAASL